jgi:hypothetical protein
MSAVEALISLYHSQECNMHGDHKDAVAANYAAMERTREFFAVAWDIPDGGNCPRAYVAWSESEDFENLLTRLAEAAEEKFSVSEAQARTEEWQTLANALYNAKSAAALSEIFGNPR